MPPALTRMQVRELDQRAIREFGVPGIVLMENAGRGVAEWLLELGAGPRVVICCGSGNNGGDGLVIARHLDRHGLETTVVLFAEPSRLQGEALTNYRIVERAGIPILVQPDAATLKENLASAAWVVDALLGTGLTEPVRAPYAAAIDHINTSNAKVLAVDLPSGLDCDTGKPLGMAVRAAYTATMVAYKAGFLTPAVRAWTGEIKVVDIGAPRRLLREFGLSDSV